MELDWNQALDLRLRTRAPGAASADCLAAVGIGASGGDGRS